MAALNQAELKKDSGLWKLKRAKANDAFYWLAGDKVPVKPKIKEKEPLEPVAPEPPPYKFKVGEYVKIIQATKGWGRARLGDIGQIVAINNLDTVVYVLQGKTFNGWNCVEADIESIPEEEQKKLKEELEDVVAEFEADGNWLHKVEFHLRGEYKKIKVSDLRTGCGIGQVYGLGSFLDEKSSVELKRIMQGIIKYYNSPHNCTNNGYGIGMLIGTLGHYQKPEEKWILKAGFKILAEYHNWRHDTKEIQTLYGYEMPMYTSPPKAKPVETPQLDLPY